MARKTAQYTVPDEGRDHGKVFVITEMPSEQGEDWAMRAMCALMQSNVDVPDGFLELGMAGLVEIGLKKLVTIKWELAKPLMNELFECVTYIPDPKKTHVSRALVGSDIEEIMTRFNLRMEVLKLHVDFSKAAGLSESLLGMVKAAAPKRPTKTSRS
jgi:hypothetical protein